MFRVLFWVWVVVLGLFGCCSGCGSVFFNMVVDAEKIIICWLCGLAEAGNSRLLEVNYFMRAALLEKPKIFPHKYSHFLITNKS